MKTILLFILRGYKRVISPILLPACRFWPTCSDYCCQAIEKYGIWRGCWLGFKRLLRCHPFHEGGMDPLN